MNITRLNKSYNNARLKATTHCHNYGTQEWYLYERMHSLGGKPTVIGSDGTCAWYQNGTLHRDDDLPAMENGKNSKYVWYHHGKLHRDADKPAVICGGSIEWYQHGVMHRDGDLPAAKYVNGTQMWYQHGKLHRDTDNPSVIYRDDTLIQCRNWKTTDNDSTRVWYCHGKRHRNGKPAVISSDGNEEWYYHGEPCK